MNDVTLAVLIARIGPYHAARLRALAEVFGEGQVTAIEVSAATNEYAWDAVATEGFRRVTLHHGAYEELSREQIRTLVTAALSRLAPAAVALPGWGFAEARAALAWCRANGRAAVLMSDSQERDVRRSWPREWVKRKIVQSADAALVGGSRHRDYLMLLGFPSERIFTGYDTVDVAHFARGADRARGDAAALRAKLGLPERYLLSTSRLVEKKNVLGLVRGYAAYRKRVSNAFDLVLVGDGPLREQVQREIRTLSLDPHVRLVGFVQYDELPAYYGLGSAFVLASTQEQWGLVVNEAMAAGLPALVSLACGSAPELVVEGRTGFTFDPSSTEAIASAMARLHEVDASAMGAAAREQASLFDSPTFAKSMQRAVASALEHASAPRGLFSSLVLRF